jgi:Tfp pilus assembly protein PilO
MQKLKIDKYITVFCIVAVVGLLELFFLLPLEITKLSDLHKKIDKIRADINAFTKEWPRKDGYIKNIENIKAEIESIKNKISVSGEESHLFSFISSASKNYAVEIKVLKPQELKPLAATKSGEVKYLPINIRLRSQFHSLAQFLDYLQNSEHFFDVREITIKGGYPYDEIEAVICTLIKE